VQEKHLSFLQTRIIDQEVEVQTKNGQVYSRIFDVAKNESNNMGEVISIITIFLVARGIE
jgi:hypothetical protein